MKRLPVLILLGCLTGVAVAGAPDNEAQRVGEAVLKIQAALANPSEPGAMEAVTELGHDSRYYTMVRGWLVQELSGVRSIETARGEDADPAITERREFLEAAIRRIDLE